MTATERRAHAKKMKEQGTEAFKIGDFATAINRYEDGVEYITWDAHGVGSKPGQYDDSDSEEDFDDDGGQKPPAAGDGEEKQEGEEEKGLSKDDKELAVALLNNC